MNSLERFYATIERKPVDRPATWLGMPDPASLPGLFKEYGVTSLHELKHSVGEDIYAVEPPYYTEEAKAIYAAFDWYGKGEVDAQNRTLTADGCFKDAEELEDLEFFKWPDPKLGMHLEKCAHLFDEIPDDAAVLGVMWSAHFQDACAAFGMETALINMLDNPKIVDAVNRKVLDFYLEANEMFYRAVAGKLHAVLIGNDMGSQHGLMLSPELVRRFIIPGCRELVAQAHAHGLKVIYHSCGSIDAIIPDLIDAGVDAIHPIQSLAAGMDAESLKARFGNQVSFCGGVDTQKLLVSGTPEEIKKRIRELMTLFPTGLIVSPSHEAILPDIPPENIRAMFDAVTM
ncbi:MAG: uroporphyrinogen decarboxylase family protein [Christensenellales bacterium]|jgi:uroporphyrinogen decarboxylase